MRAFTVSVLLLAGCTPSPGGSSSSSSGGPLDAGGTGRTGLRVNEVYVDRDLSGDAVEFVEVAGPAGTPLAGLSLRLVDASGTARYDVALSETDGGLPANGLWVVGGSRADTDQSYGISVWGLDNTAGAVQLVRHADGGTALVDVVGYGAAPAAAHGAPVQTVETSAAALPAAAGQSMGRRDNAPDTDHNAADFCVQVSSPRAPNTACR